MDHPIQAARTLGKMFVYDGTSTCVSHTGTNYDGKDLQCNIYPLIKD